MISDVISLSFQNQLVVILFAYACFPNFFEGL
jgi:hypothetical protein